MWNRNRTGLAVILLLLIFDAVVIKYEKTGDARKTTSCNPAGNINAGKNADSKKQDPVSAF